MLFFLVRSCTPGFPKRLTGNNTYSLCGTGGDCALTCFHGIAYHINIDTFCSPVFPVRVLFSVASNFADLHHLELQSGTPTRAGLSWLSLLLLLLGQV